MNYLFPASGVEVNLLIPPLTAFVISVFSAMGGLSGAFLLLPFQMSVLGYTAPSVSGTNHVYNVVAIPGGVYRFIKEGRMAWPLTLIIVAGSVPGVFIGFYVRVIYLPDPGAFKVFVGLVLLYIGTRLIYSLFGGKETAKEKPHHKACDDQRVNTLSATISKVELSFRGEKFCINNITLFVLSTVVGMIGGIYGIGGGAIIAPFLVTFFRLPVYVIAGAALMGTFVTSLAGAIFFGFLPPINGVETKPDWLLGFTFGVGGFAGTYFGAKFQKRVPERLIKGVLGVVITLLSISYIFR